MNDLPRIENNADVRFLGATLGEVIRAYGGETLFAATETIRKASVDRHRHGGDGHALDLGLEKLGLDETLDFVRGFMLFSMLANLAEDRQGIAADRDADVASALQALAEAGRRPRRDRRPARAGAGLARAHRAPDRGQAQEHDRSPRPHRRADGDEGCGP